VYQDQPIYLAARPSPQSCQSPPTVVEGCAGAVGNPLAGGLPDEGGMPSRVVAMCHGHYGRFLGVSYVYSH